MNEVLKEFSNAFPAFAVAIQARPDGGAVISLEADSMTLRRALTSQQCVSSKERAWVVEALRRDLALTTGSAPEIQKLQSQNRFALPTYGDALLVPRARLSRYAAASNRRHV
ncbi:MAG: DUF3509 domain-containing protein [Pseudomonas sp.]|uniref:DUF3509 domain-containing protein n=1 Tax=Pseudomonas sp. TaxID=306 RepID=UPI0033948AF1